MVGKQNSSVQTPILFLHYDLDCEPKRLNFVKLMRSVILYFQEVRKFRRHNIGVTLSPLNGLLFRSRVEMTP